MLSARQSGVLAHVTSLPNAEGMGALGPEAFAFIDRLADAGQAVWQILPLNPTQIDGSPYAALSSFAGAEHVISLTQLGREGWLTPAELAPLAALDRRRIDFAQALPLRRSLVARAAGRFRRGASMEDAAACAAFRAKSGPQWLDDYALFRAALERHAWADWSDWPEALRLRRPDALAAARADLAPRIEEICVEQFFFDRQWRAVRAHAAARGVAIFGDMPIYVAQTSADVWAASHYFHLDAHGKPITVAGCPPDMMAAGGQRWGNPTYRWEVMQADGFAWWKQRLAHMLEWYDLVRIDHFRAFASYWEIPAADENAINGRWIPAPGHPLFQEIAKAFGAPAVVAEDLGFITPDVYELRDAFGFPGMRIIQYELEEEPLAPGARPEAFPPNSVAYFGNHDNETALGWLCRWRDQLSPEQIAKRPILAAALASAQPHAALIDLTLASGSNLAVLQMQDILGLGADARMNVPGTASGNWGWRFEEAETPPALWADLARRTRAAGRAAPQPSAPARDGRLEALLAEADAEFLARQHPATGLLPAGPAHNSHGDYSHAWVRDNCYCVLAIWAASAAARRDGQGARAARYADAAERLMRGLLAAMQGQAHKVERFLRSRSPADALHAKYDAATGQPVSGDADWGHLQIDATALYLLLCADMTAGGLSIIRTRSEAGFLDQLSQYVALAWRCGDYGMWERGDKRNIGRVERNSSSIGLSLAALRALPRVAFRLAGEAEAFRTTPAAPETLALFEETLRGALPEESYSKEIDAGLLSAVGYPGFALSDAALVEAVRAGVRDRLAGRYGAARFLLDGHQSPHEHPHRLHYEPGELAAFAGLECQWPLFYAFEAADAALRGAHAEAQAAIARLEAVAAAGPGWPLIPELYRVEAESAAAERLYPNSQTRRPNDNVPLYWAQSLYLVARLLSAGLIAPEDLDPLQRRAGEAPAQAAAPPLQRLLARGLMLRDAHGRWRDALSEGAIEGSGFEAFPASLFAALAEEAEALHVRYGRAVIGLDLPALAPGGAALVRRLARAQPLDLAGGDPLRRDWRLWRAEHGALAPVGGGFARMVWASLSRCAGREQEPGARIDAALSRADHTEGERAFAHQLLFALTGCRDLELRTLIMEALLAFAEGDRRVARDVDVAAWIGQAGGAELLAGLAPAAVRPLLEAAMPGVKEEAPLRASAGK